MSFLKFFVYFFVSHLLYSLILDSIILIINAYRIYKLKKQMKNNKKVFLIPGEDEDQWH